MPIDAARLREAIQAVYGEVAGDPKKGYHFHTGPTYAVDHLGYAAADLGDLPDSVSGPFAGVGAPLSLRRAGPQGRSGSASSCNTPGRAAASIPSWLPRPWAQPGGSSPST